MNKTDTIRILATGTFECGFEMSKLDYPGIWKEHEIREIPASTWERMKQRSPLTDDPNKIADREGRQAHFVNVTRLFREGKEAQRARNVARYERNAVADEVRRMLALEKAEKIGKLGKIASKKLGIEA